MLTKPDTSLRRCLISGSERLSLSEEVGRSKAALVVNEDRLLMEKTVVSLSTPSEHQAVTMSLYKC